MWRFEHRTIADIRLALSRARAATEAELGAKRALTTFRAQGPRLYIVYFRGLPAGPFPLTAPYDWPRIDLASMKVVAEAAFAAPSAVSLYAHYLLSAKNERGELLSPAGRVDLLLGRRLATALPDDHPARQRPPNLKTIDPVLFYNEPEDE